MCITKCNLVYSKTTSYQLVYHVRGALLVWKENFRVATNGVHSPVKHHPGGSNYGTQGLYHHEVPEQSIQIPPQVGGLEHQLPNWSPIIYFQPLHLLYFHQQLRRVDSNFIEQNLYSEEISFVNLKFFKIDGLTCLLKFLPDYQLPKSSDWVGQVGMRLSENIKPTPFLCYQLPISADRVGPTKLLGSILMADKCTVLTRTSSWNFQLNLNFIKQFSKKNAAPSSDRDKCHYH